jgi:hypothetical protein
MQRLDVFFYGLFMDEEVLRARGFDPREPRRAILDGFSLRIGRRAAVVRTPEARVHGLVFSLAPSELERLYADPGVQAYRPEEVLVRIEGDGVVPALCYNLPVPPSVSERSPEYVEQLRIVARKVGLPAEYIAGL